MALFCSEISISLVFDESVIYPWTDQRTDGPTDLRTIVQTDGWADGRTDRPADRDARAHLKTQYVASSMILTYSGTPLQGIRL